MPLVSICIPAYKRVDTLKRLLESIATQTFRDMEVVVTDDSPDDSVALLCGSFNDKMPLRYIKNPVALGTPENWNEAVRQSTGDWIKIMHDDDSFSEPESLSKFVSAIKETNAAFIFSAYQNKWVNSDRSEIVRLTGSRKSALKKNPVSLLSKNVIGPPSTTLYKNVKISYDQKMKWLVDMDFYIRYLKNSSFYYIDEPLINIGIHETQVTASSKLKPEVEIPEHLLLIEKTGNAVFRNIYSYDALWRLIRNLGISGIVQVKSFAGSQSIPSSISAMIGFQKMLPKVLLKFGPTSKLFMFFSYFGNRLRR